MMTTKIATTIVSTKGQVILPKSVREIRHWVPGTRLMVEETADGVLLRSASHFAATSPEQVFGSLSFDGDMKSIEEMDLGIAAEARRQHAGD